MKILSYAIAPVIALCLALPAQAEKISLSEISRYLNELRTVEGEFTQINADGTVSTGTVYIHRPGRVRFEYVGDQTLMLASAGKVAVFDRKSNQSHQEYPLSKTPLSIILAANVNLGQANMVTAHTEKDTATIVTAQDPKHPEYGNIQMVFTAGPTELRQWVVTDDTGEKTTVILGDMKTGGSIPSSKFSISAEVQRRR